MACASKKCWLKCVKREVRPEIVYNCEIQTYECGVQWKNSLSIYYVSPDVLNQKLWSVFDLCIATSEFYVTKEGPIWLKQC